MTVMAAAPLTRAEFAVALGAIGCFESRPLIAVAVSGGPDSLALAILADDWARRRGGTAWALTIDHGLRLESGDEIRLLRGWLAGRGIPHDVLTWTGDKPASGIQQAAREARYRLLARWCRAKGCLHLLTAHHREDQAETYLMRRRAGSGPDGLAAMPALRELPGCRVLRPLLGVPKARLVALLEAGRQPFVVDPSNRSPRFERSRWRLDDGEGSAIPEIAALLDRIRGFGRERAERERAADARLACAVVVHPAGFAALDLRSALAEPSDLAEHVLARVARTLGGARHPLRRERVARLRAGLVAEPERGRTLGGCRFVPWRGRMLVVRETAAAAAPVRVAPGTLLSWDRRFAAALPPTANRPVTLGYLGAEGTAELGRRAPRARDVGLPRLLHSILPAFWDEEGLLAVPHLTYRRQLADALPLVAFRPVIPLTHARFTVVSSSGHPIF
jgi:tRNA(Ile)-lysidine synthase